MRPGSPLGRPGATLRAGVWPGVGTPLPHRRASLRARRARSPQRSMAVPGAASASAEPAPRAGRAAPSAAWLPIAVLAAAQFVMVLDSSVMNVSISQIVKDLDTSIQGVQLAITAYTLVMAAL